MSEVLTPITRIEEYLDGIVNGGAIPLEPVTRVEQFLDAIANSQTCALTPVTRIEAYLGKISGQSLTLPEPVTRVEMYLAAIAGEDVIVPDAPVTRIEMYLAEWIGGCSPEYATVTGSYVSFVTTRSAPLKELVVDINPVQSGSGDPSPNNVRPISGWTAAQIWVDDTHDTSAQADYNISWQTEAGTVYGGTLTVNEDGSGVLVEDWVGIEIDGTTTTLNVASTSYIGETTTRGYLGGKPKPYSNSMESRSMCDCAVWGAVSEQGKQSYRIAVVSNAAEITMRILNSLTGITSADTTAQAKTKLNAYLANNPAKVVYKIETPNSYNLTAQQVITALSGQNYLWADTGNVSVTYRSN